MGSKPKYKLQNKKVQLKMKQTFIVTIDSEDKITSKEVAECLNNTVGGYSLNFGHDYAIIATVRKENKKKNSK